MNVLKFDGIGTKWEVEVFSPITSDQMGYLGHCIKQRVEEYEQTYSRFRSDSFVNTSLLQKGIVSLPSDSEKLFSIYQKLYSLTEGLFTPFIGQVLIDAGYDSAYSLIPKQLHTPPLWEEVAEYTFPRIHIKKSEVFDFGAAGKGHLIDIVSQLITESGFSQYCVDAGRDIRLSSKNSIRIGLENPSNLEEAIGVVSIASGSICASSGNRRTWSGYHHIINPKTLTSPNTVLATWVVASEALLADALSTCLFLVPVTKLSSQFSFEYLTLFSDYSFEKSSGFPAEVFLNS
jgi:thiamine biosynthesis lipoprotein